MVSKNNQDGEIKIVQTSCCHDCGGRCALKAHVKNGVIIRIDTDGGEEPQLRACLRGRAYRKRVYAPDRVQFPMKRVGERGEGKFERISWDEALDTVATQLKRVKETYGTPSILLIKLGGSQSFLHGRGPVQKLITAFGGCLERWSSLSAEGSLFSSMATYGTLHTGNTRDDLLNSRLIIMWGWNPAHSIWGTNTTLYLARAKEAGTKIVCVDPRFTDSVATFADQWIPIRPGTDTAMLVAMAYVMITENLQDQKFLDTYTIGFDKFKDYVLGKEDGVAKTPQWAEAITKVPATVIANLAREYATTKPAALFAPFGAARSAMGEQYNRVAATLTAMTGNIGIHGGNAAGAEWIYPSSAVSLPPSPPNPVAAMVTPRKNVFAASTDKYLRTLRGAANPSTNLHTCEIYDAILKGKAGGYPSDIKLLYVVCSDPVNQFPNINKGIKALKKLEFIVVHEQSMTPTAKFADIVLPINTFMERNDICRPWGIGAPYWFYMNKAIEPMYESKTDLQICRELAPRLGIFDYDDREEEERLKEIARGLHVPPEYDKFKKESLFRVKLSEPLISFKEQIEDPKNNPFPTPSGKIEIYSQLLAEMNDPKMPPIPKYIETWESPNDPLAKAYPLQLITPHSRRRTHSILDNIQWLKELEPQRVWISSADAQSRNIKDGDDVRVFNYRGEMILPARVTERIMPGVVSIEEGAWYNPDKKGVDRGGCANVLTNDEHSPGGAFSANTALVQIQKV